MFILAAVLSVVMGLTLGLLGGGGSILTLPILTYGLGVETKPAIATSLLVVGITSIGGVIQHARAGNVVWKVGLLFGAVSMVGAYFGGQVAGYIPGVVLMLLFAAMMVAAAVAMIRKKSKPGDDDESAEPKKMVGKDYAMVVGEGLLVGAITGLVGAGGGFVVVPALVLMSGLNMRKAVGTSLLVIAMKSLSGTLGHLSHTSIDWTLAGVVSASAVVGVVIGTSLSHKIPQAALKKGFGWFVLVMAGVVLYKEMTAEIFNTMLAYWPAGLGALVVGVGGYALFKHFKGGESEDDATSAA